MERQVRLFQKDLNHVLGEVWPWTSQPQGLSSETERQCVLFRIVVWVRSVIRLQQY